MYVKIRRHQHTRAHAHTGPRRHAREGMLYVSHHTRVHTLLHTPNPACPGGYEGMGYGTSKAKAPCPYMYITVYNYNVYIYIYIYIYTQFIII